MKQDRLKANSSKVRNRISVMALGVAAAALLATSPMAAEIKTIEPGKLTIGMNGDMPMTQIKDGQLSGTDGELMVYVAKKIGLEPNPKQMDWAAEIESTKQGKLDIMHGAMGWLESRTKIMILSEPIYYFGTLLAQKEDTNYHSFAEAKWQVNATHPCAGAQDGRRHWRGQALRHLGRCHAGPPGRAHRHGDPRSAAHAICHRTASGMEAEADSVDPEPDKYPVMSTKYSVIFGINKNQPELAEAVNAAIKDIWKECLNVKTMAKYGLSDKAWFVPPRENPHRGRQGRRLQGAHRRSLFLMPQERAT